MLKHPASKYPAFQPVGLKDRTWPDAVINIHPPTVLFALFVVYGLSGYAVYAWRKAKGRPTSVISTSTDEPDERGLHD